RNAKITILYTTRSRCLLGAHREYFRDGYENISGGFQVVGSCMPPEKTCLSALANYSTRHSPVKCYTPMAASAAPAMTLLPTSAVRSGTLPASCAMIGCSTFIASRTKIRSTSETLSPTSTPTLTIVPCMGEVTVSPEPPAAVAPLVPVALREGRRR